MRAVLENACRAKESRRLLLGEQAPVSRLIPETFAHTGKASAAISEHRSESGPKAIQQAPYLNESLGG